MICLRSLLLFICLCLASLSLTTLPTFAQEAAPPAEADILSGDAISAGDAIPSDGAIERRIEGIFQELESLQNVSVTVRSGVVALSGTVPDQNAIDQAEQLAARVEGVVAVANQLREDTTVTERIVPVMERLKARSLQALNYIPLLSVAIIVFLIIAIAGWWLAARRWPFERIAPNAFISGLLRQIVRLAFLGLGLVLALDILGASALIGTVLGAAGIVGLAVGFAVRDTVENYIASILLSLRQPFRPNDFVDIDGHQGRVIMLTSRATVLLSLDGNHIRIPNATVFKSVITNFSRHPERRFGFEIGIDPNDDLQKGVEIGREELERLSFVLNKPGPEAWVERLADSTVQLWFAAWIDQRETDFKRSRAQAMLSIKSALEKAGFTLPEPGMRVTMVETRPKPKPAPASEAIVTDDVAVHDDVAEIVEEERAQMKEQDLLKDGAPQEMG